MRGTGCEAVVLHRKYPVTKQMHRDRLAFGKKMAIKIKNKDKKKVSITIFEKILFITEKNIIITSPFFYE